MNSLKSYDNIEIGDTIIFPNTFLNQVSGVITSIRKHNQRAMQVKCSNGATFEVSRNITDFVLWDNN